MPKPVNIFTTPSSVWQKQMAYVGQEREWTEYSDVLEMSKGFFTPRGMGNPGVGLLQVI